MNQFRIKTQKCFIDAILMILFYYTKTIYKLVAGRWESKIKKNVSLGVSICLDVVSIKTLDLDTEKKSVSTARKSRQFQKVSLDDRDREISILSRHVRKSPKSLDRDREIRRDMTFLANLDSLSRSRVSQCYHISRSRFLNLSRFLSLKSQKSLEKVLIMSRNLKNSR